jgi:glycosyltransferase involved in cell wall biosynthesis
MTANPRVTILIPVYDDWTSLDTLIRSLDTSLGAAGMQAELLVVNDASPTDGGELNLKPPWASIDKIQILDLRRNLGHQRAIAIGLAWLDESGVQDPVVVMDGDGEDAPSQVPLLYAACQKNGFTRLVFARRNRRSEAFAFRSLYIVYQRFYRMLTGHELRVGNFSIIPSRILRRLVVVSELWNHYSAAVMKARIPYEQLPLDRSKRIAGRSKMNYVSLVAHGLSSISVHGDTVGTRMLILAVGLILSGLTGIVAVVFLKTETSLAIPGWATSASGLLISFILQACMLSLGFILVILGGRNASSFIPCRDFQPYVDQVRTVLTP